MLVEKGLKMAYSGTIKGSTNKQANVQTSNQPTKERGADQCITGTTTFQTAIGIMITIPMFIRVTTANNNNNDYDNKDDPLVEFIVFLEAIALSISNSIVK